MKHFTNLDALKMARPMKLLALVSGAVIIALSTNNNYCACDAASSTATATATSSASHDATSSSTSHAHHDHPSRTTATATAATTHDNDAKLIASFEEICFFRPKSCTTSSFSFVETPTSTKKDEESYKCSLETLNGLSSTRETMQTNIQLLPPSSSSSENSNNNNNISEEEELLGRQLELAHVRLEEAAVGCTLLYYYYYNSVTENNEHDVASEDADVSEALLIHSSACPTPKTCNYESNSCTLSALHQLHQSREIMEQAFQKLAYSLDDDGNSSSSHNSNSNNNNNHKPIMSNNQEQWMRRRLEIAELSVEEAAISCTLLLQQIKNNANNKPVGEEQPQATKETTKLLSRIKNDGSTTTKPPPTMVVPFPSNDILQDEDKLDFFLSEHFPDEMYKLSKLKVRRVNMQDILRGVGEMPDVQGKDRMRRDGIIRELKLEEARIRKRLLMQLHELNLRQKNKREDEKEDEDGQNNIVNREERRMEANKESPPECANSNSSENDQTTTACTRDDDDYPSTKDGAVSKMKKDIDFLKNKAHEASTEGERDARWRMVRSLEEKLEQMTIRL